jgi:pimeloyl-ACP methyl ester carboxylesterase
MASFVEPHFVQTNGIRMAVYEQGRGFPVVLCHGFPELAYSWRHQLPALAAAGFRAIAPDQRGYGRTDVPPQVEAYDMMHLTDDMAGLLDALRIDRAVFCGHDWGGAVVWNMAMMHRDRVAGVIGVNTPHMPRAPMDPLELMRQTMGEDMYIVFFNRSDDADRLLAADVPRTMRFFYRRATVTLEEFDALPPDQRNLALEQAFKAPESEWIGEPLLSDEELAYYVEAFEKTGFTGALNWYRNFTRNWERSAGLDYRIELPCLMICAANDIALRPELADGMDAFCPDLEKHVIADCGHWTQAEKPEALNALMIDWLTRRFR